MILILEISGPLGDALGASRRKVFRNAGGTIGRSARNDWMLPNQYVAPQHAVIRFQDGVFTIEDTSINGIYASSPDRRLAKGVPHVLQPGDHIFIEPYEIHVSLETDLLDGILAGTRVRREDAGDEAHSDWNVLPTVTPAPSAPPADPLQEARRQMETDAIAEALEALAAAAAPPPTPPHPPASAPPSSRPPLAQAEHESARDAHPAADPFESPPLPSPMAPPPPAPFAAPPTAPAPGQASAPASARSGGRWTAAARRTPPSGESPSTSPPSGKDGSRYRVWFGTNRRPVERSGKTVGFSADRHATVSLGWCRVSIPRSHRIGSVGSPWWKRMLTRVDDRLKVTEVQTLSDDRYWSEVTAALSRGGVGRHDAVVFLHGYNITFEQAALRAAQLGFDLGVEGVMAFYSWPSQGTLGGYSADEAAIEASEGFITDYLTAMATRSGAAKVHIIAHSMGNRGLARAIDRIATDAAARADVPFAQIILAAADIDQDTFQRLGLRYQKVAARTTMYVSSRDRAVEASHWLHDFPRAGLAPPVLVVPGIDTVNVSNLDLTLLGHGYVAEAREVLQDMHRLLGDGEPPERRFGLRQTATPDGRTYWEVGE